MFNENYYRFTNFQVDVNRLFEESKTLAWNKESGQFDLQVALQSGGTGSHPGQADEKWGGLREDLFGTYWEEFFKSLPVPVYRSRIMMMKPRTCYSIHSDMNPRLHIAIKTHDHARFIFTEEPSKIIHIPSDGYMYYVNTRLQHTAINASLIERWHIVMSLVNIDDEI
jgi:hypothetical protein